MSESQSDSDERPTPGEILERVSEYGAVSKGGVRAETKAALRRYCRRHVKSEKMVTSQNIINTIDIDLRSQEIGRALGLKRADEADILPNIEVSKWGSADTNATWVLRRVDGEWDPGDKFPTPNQKSQIVREVLSAVETETEEMIFGRDDMADRDLSLHRVPLPVLRIIVRVVLERTETYPDLVSDGDRRLREHVSGLGRKGAVRAIENAIGISVSGDRGKLDRETYEAIHKVVVSNASATEVGYATN